MNAQPTAQEGAAGVQRETSLRGVVVRGLLRGVTIPFTSRVTLLLDADGDGPGPRPAASILRLLAGIERPSAGLVRVFGLDPARTPSLRREIALLGDSALLDGVEPLEDGVVAIAAVRGVAELTSRDRVRAVVREAPSIAAARKILADRLAAPERARLVLVSHPERRVDPAARERVTKTVNDALAAGVSVVLATTRLDDWLHLAQASDAAAVLLSGGVVLAVGPAHGLPWAAPSGGSTVRLVRVAVRPAQADAHAAAPAIPSAHKLAADLLSDAEIAPSIVAVETVGPTELRVHTRDPRALARSVARRASEGLDVTKLVVQGATAGALAESFAGARR